MRVRPTQAERLLAVLRDGVWHSSGELADAGGLRFGARLLELRLAGHAIETRRRQDRSDVFGYALVSPPRETASPLPPEGDLGAGDIVDEISELGDLVAAQLQLELAA